MREFWHAWRESPGERAPSRRASRFRAAGGARCRLIKFQSLRRPDIWGHVARPKTAADRACGEDTFDGTAKRSRDAVWEPRARARPRRCRDAHAERLPGQYRQRLGSVDSAGSVSGTACGPATVRVPRACPRRGRLYESRVAVTRSPAPDDRWVRNRHCARYRAAVPVARPERHGDRRVEIGE